MIKALSRTKLIALISTVFVGHFFVDLMLSIWPVYKTMADLDLAKAGIISGLCALLGEGSQMLFGPLGDRGYYRAIAGIGVILTAASTLFVYSNTYFFLFLLFLSTYIGSGAFHPTGLGFVGSVVSRRSRRVMVAYFVMAGAFGMAVGQIIYREVFYLFEGETAILALPVVLGGAFLLFPKSEEEKEFFALKKSKTHHTFRDVFSFFLNRDLRCLYVVQVCAQALLWTIIFLLPDVLTNREYPNWISLGGGHMAFILGFGSIMVPAGYLAKRYSSRFLILGAMLLGSLSIYTLLAFPFLTNGLTLALLFTVGVSIGVVSPVALGLGQEMVPEKPGAISAFLMGAAWCVAECIGPVLGGVLTKLFVEDAPAKSLALMATLFVVGFIAIYIFNEPELEADETA